MKQPHLQKILPLVILFILVNMLIWIFRDFLSRNETEINFIVVANIIIFLITFFGFIFQTRGLRTANINAFLRGIYGSLMMKMFIVMAAVFIYVLSSDGKVNKPALFISMGLYIVYTAIEVFQLMKIVRKKPDA